MRHGSLHHNQSKTQQARYHAAEKRRKTCQLVECTVPLDTNLADTYYQKEIKYIPLISELQRMYHGYKVSTVIITIGALAAVPKSLATNLGEMPLNKDRIEIITQRLQRAALIGTLKVCKTVLKTDSLYFTGHIYDFVVLFATSHLELFRSSR